MKRKCPAYDNPWHKKATKYVCSNLSTKDSYFECPACFNNFPLTVIDGHMSSHEKEFECKVNNECSTSVEVAHNVFSVLMTAMNKKPVKMIYSLQLIDSVISPLITFENELLVSIPVSPNANSWMTETLLKNFPINFKSDERTDDLKMIVYTNIPSFSTPNTTDTSYKSSAVYIQVLKSMLQKAVRRRTCGSVARLAVKLLSMENSEFFRRCIIIMVEDGALHCLSPIITWLVVAVSKGYQPPDFLVAITVLSLIEVSFSKWRDLVPFEATPTAPNSSLSLSNLPPGGSRTLVASLLVRCSYGGAAFDMSLLLNTAKLWTSRLFPAHWEQKQSLDTTLAPSVSSDSKFIISSGCGMFLSDEYVKPMYQSLWRQLLLPDTSSDEYNNLHEVRILNNLIFQVLRPSGVSPSVRLTDLLRLRRIDLVAEAIDTHCDRNIVDHVMSTAALTSSSKYSKMDIGEAIWLFRGSVNNHTVWQTDPQIDDSGAETLPALMTIERRKEKLVDLWHTIYEIVELYCQRKIYAIGTHLVQY